MWWAAFHVNITRAGAQLLPRIRIPGIWKLVLESGRIFAVSSRVAMKESTHPVNYPVLFVDGEHQWTGVSTLKSNDTRTIDGVEYYVVNVEISAFSHPFYTGQKKIIDSAGRVEKFMRRYGQSGK